MSTEKLSLKERYKRSPMAWAGIAFVILVLALCVEGFRYMAKTSLYKESGTEVYDCLDFEKVKVSGGVSIKNKKLITNRKVGSATLTVDKKSVNSISFTIESDKSTNYLALFEVYAGTSKNAAKLLGKIDEPAGQSERTYTIYFTKQSISSIFISVPSQRGYFRITNVTMGQAEVKPVFSVMHVFWLFLAGCTLLLVFFFCPVLIFKPEKRSHVLMLLGDLVLVFVLLYFSGRVLANQDYKKDIAYPLEKSVSSYQQYVQQFDAFQKHRVSLDVEPDPALLALENPYEPKNRTDVTYMSDRVLFEGKYYSYFGVAPIFTIYYPYYFLTGKLPAETKVLLWMAALIVIGLAAILYGLVRLFKLKLPLWFVLLALPVLAYLSGAVFFVRGRAPVYYIAALSGISGSVGYLGFLIFALLFQREGVWFVKKGKKDSKCAKIWTRVFYVLSAISAVIIVASRPSMLVATFVMSLPLLFMALFPKKTEKREPDLYAFCCLGIPVILGAVGIMLFNQARFHSPFEFGAKYMLTISDVNLNHVDFGKTKHALFYYFLRPFEKQSTWPFIRPSNVNPKFDYYVYREQSYGLLRFPFMLGLLLFPVWIIRRKKQTAEENTAGIMCLLALVVCPVMAVICYCLAGVHMRYLLDIVLAWGLGSFLTGGVVLSALREKKGYFWFDRVTLWFMIVTLWILFSLLFNMYTTNYSLYDPFLLDAFRKMLN